MCLLKQIARGIITPKSTGEGESEMNCTSSFFSPSSGRFACHGDVNLEAPFGVKMVTPFKFLKIRIIIFLNCYIYLLYIFIYFCYIYFHKFSI